jgi:hypothetical protein
VLQTKTPDFGGTGIAGDVAQRSADDEVVGDFIRGK